MPLKMTTDRPVSSAGLGALAGRVAGSAWFSYATILLLQLKVTWGMWRLRDLTAGDTSSYFVSAYQWFRDGSGAISWSPLYTSFYGSLLHLSSDAFLVTTLHRWLIVFALAALVLALMRRLLPHGLAWFMAAWWVVLPVNFDALYEVHLFAVIPVVCAAFVVLGGPGAWRRGGALAILLVASLLMRNELLVATGLLAATLLGAALWNVRFAPVRPRLGLRLVLAYVIPLVSACLLTFYYYRHASDAPVLSAMLERKHTFVNCQTYAFGYQQRHTDFNKSPWTACQELMTRIYGKPEPSLLEALRRNPPAMLEHFLWNLSLVPNGLQVLLFNTTSGKVTPDFIPVARSRVSLSLSCILLVIVAAGLIRLIRDRRYWWDNWLKERVWGWLVLIAVGLMTIGVMVSQRPRPSFMFSLGILLRAATGMLVFVLVGRSSWRRRLLVAFAAATVLMLAFTPNYYASAYRSRPQYLMKSYERLKQFEQLLEQPSTVLVSLGYGGELCNYVGKGKCRGLNYFDLRAEVTPDSPWPKVLDAHGAALVYADEAVLADPAGQRLVSEAAASAWQTLALHEGGGGRWMLLAKPAAAAGSGPEPRADILEPGQGLRLGNGWHDLETFQSESFRWAGNDAEIVASGLGERASIRLGLEPGPGVGSKPFVLKLVDPAGRELQSIIVVGRRTVLLSMPANSPGAYRLRAEGGGQPVRNDPRILNFRVFRIAPAPAGARADILESPERLRLAEGWYGREEWEGQVFRWVNNDAAFVARAARSGGQELTIEVEPGPGLGPAPFVLKVLDREGRQVDAAEVRTRQTVQLFLPLAAGQESTFVLHVSGGGKRVATDPRILNFRVFKLGLVE